MQISAMQNSSSRTGKKFTTAQTKLLSAQYSLLRVCAIKKNCISWPSIIFFPASQAYDQIFGPLICLWWIWSNLIIRFTRQSPVWAPFHMNREAILFNAKKNIMTFCYIILLWYRIWHKNNSQSINSLLLFSLSTLGSQLIDQSWPAMKWNKNRNKIQKYKANTISNSNEN